MAASPLRITGLCTLRPCLSRWRFLGHDSPDALPWTIGTTVASELFSKPVLQGGLSHMTGIDQHTDDMRIEEKPLRLGFHDFEAMV
jgi:hypothetical protein